MTTEKKTIRSDIPGSHVFLNNNIGYVGSTSEEGRRLVVGRDIALNGQIGSCDYLAVEGIVEAEVFSARRMDVLESGLFCGKAELQDCVIAGRFEGRLTVAGRLTVKSTGRLNGQIEYGTLEVETGAKIEGQLFPGASPVAEEKVPDTIANNVQPLVIPVDDATPVKTERATVYRRAVRG